MAESLNLDTAFLLALKNVYEGKYFEVVFKRYLDNGTSPENWENKPYTFYVTIEGNSVALITLTSSASEITVSGNTLTVKCPDSKNVLKGGGDVRYYYHLTKLIQTDKTIVEGNGEITVKK